MAARPIELATKGIEAGPFEGCLAIGGERSHPGQRRHERDQATGRGRRDSTRFIGQASGSRREH